MYFASLVPIAVLAIACVPTSGFQNEWDGPLSMTCPPNQFVYRIYSIHDNKKEDRRWQYYCKSFPGETITHNNCVWSSYVNSYDGVLDYTCPGNRVITGVDSHHNNRKEDRVFKFRCSDISVSNRNCYSTSWINDWDGVMNYAVPYNHMLVGFYSYHSDKKEDRRWKVKLCQKL